MAAPVMKTAQSLPRTVHLAQEGIECLCLVLMLQASGAEQVVWRWMNNADSMKPFCIRHRPPTSSAACTWMRRGLSEKSRLYVGAAAATARRRRPCRRAAAVAGALVGPAGRLWAVAGPVRGCRAGLEPRLKWPATCIAVSPDRLLWMFYGNL